MASRAKLVAQFLWLSEQALEKYLKCTLLLRQFPPKTRRSTISGPCSLSSTRSARSAPTSRAGQRASMRRLDQYGRYSRYFEISNLSAGAELVTLDRAVWEIRRYCEPTMDSASSPRSAGAIVALRDGDPAPCLNPMVAISRRSSTIGLTWLGAPSFGRTPSLASGGEEKSG